MRGPSFETLSRVGLGVLTCLVASSPAAAQDQRAASVLAFDEAKRLMSEGKVSEACPKFAESQRLDAQLGTLLHLADCLEQNGQTASAWASFRDAAEVATSRNDPRREVAEERIRALVPRLSRLLIEVKAGAGVHVERDGTVVGEALLGAPVPVDPGPHTLTASKLGRQTWTGKVVVPADGSITTVEIPELGREVPTSPEASAAPTTTTTTSQTPRDEGVIPPERNSFLADRWPALVAGGLGIAGVAVGSAFGLRSMSKGREAEDHCDDNRCRDLQGVKLKKDAISAGNVSTVAFAVGAAGLAGAAVLWFTLPPSREGRAGTARAFTRVGVTPTGLEWEHSF